MKKILCTIIVLLTVSVNANSYKWPIADDFSNWLRIKDFSKHLESVPSNKYPAVIQALPLLGDGVTFRALLLLKPNQYFEHKFIYGKSKEEFAKLNTKYSKSGFILIHKQTVQLMNVLSHQATWVKSSL